MRKRYAFIAVVSILSLAIGGCAAAAPQETKMESGMPAAAEGGRLGGASAELDAGGVTYAGVERLIVRNASLDMVVADTQAAMVKVHTLADELGGYVVESNMYQYQEGWRASVKLRVPSEKFEPALERVRALATEVRQESISGQDVTEEYVDLRSRLRHLQATEARLLEFLEKAEDTKAALEVSKNLDTIQAEIEQVKGRMEYLEQSAAMATISLDLTPDELAQPIEVGGWHPEGTLRNAFQALVHVLQFLVDAAIVIVVLIIPVVIAIAAPIVGGIWLMRRIIRWRSRKARPGQRGEG